MPGDTICPDATLLREFMLGQIGAAHADTLERHLESCVACNDLIDRQPAEDGLVVAMRARSAVLSQVEGPALDQLISGMTRLHEHVECGVSNRSATPLPWRVTPLTMHETQSYDFLDAAEAVDELGRFGPYRVKRVLGSGGMGVVFEATDPRLKRTVALKVLLDSRFTNPSYLTRFEREAEALARLRHPNIVQIHEVGRQRQRPYFALEYVAGGSLAQQLAGQPQPIRESCNLVRTLAQAVQHAHEQGVVHRDLKPANVLLAGGGVANVTPQGASSSTTHHAPIISPKITDFGLAKHLSEEDITQTGDLLGTPGYMAPEMTQGQSRDTGRAVDIYALGAILYELLTGRPPFRGETVLDTLEQVRTLDPVPLRRLRARVPRDLETICLKCLAKEPGRRYETAAALADDLGRFLENQPIRARPVSFVERTWKWARRRPALAGLLALGVLFLVTVVVGVLVHNARLQTVAGVAQREQQRADAGYKQARAALKRMLDRLEEKGRQDVPRLKELQREQLEDALTFYQEILKEQDNPDPAIRFDVATACHEAAHLQSRLGQYELAETNFKQGETLLEALSAESPDRPEYLEQLATTRDSLGDTYVQRRRFGEAEVCQQQALELREHLHRSRPKEGKWQDSLAASHHSLAMTYQLSGNWTEAEKHLDEAIALRMSLDNGQHENRHGVASLAGDYINLYQVLINTQRPDKAESACAKAVSLLEPLVKEDPQNLEQALFLGAALANWGELKRGRHDLPQAIVLLTRAIQLEEEVLRQEPQYEHARQRLINAYGPRGLAYLDQFRFADAIRDWDRLVDLAKEPERYYHRLNRALILAMAGERIRAAAEAKELATDTKVAIGDSRGTLARIYGQCLQSLPAARPPSTAEKAHFEDYAARAMRLLQEAAAAGFFKEPGRVQGLKTSSELAPLRSRAEFKKLVGELERQ